MVKGNKEWLYEKYKREFIDINDFIQQPPSSDITKQSYLASFGNYYIKKDKEYSSKTLYAIFWRALDDAKKSIEYNKNKDRKELIKDKSSSVKQISNREYKKPEQLKFNF